MVQWSLTPPVMQHLICTLAAEKGLSFTAFILQFILMDLKPRSWALNSFLLHIRDLIGISSYMCRWTLYNLGALILACLRYNVVIGYESSPFSEIQIFPKPVVWELHKRFFAQWNAWSIWLSVTPLSLHLWKYASACAIDSSIGIT